MASKRQLQQQQSEQAAYESVQPKKRKRGSEEPDDWSGAAAAAPLGGARASSSGSLTPPSREKDSAPAPRRSQRTKRPNVWYTEDYDTVHDPRPASSGEVRPPPPTAVSLALEDPLRLMLDDPGVDEIMAEDRKVEKTRDMRSQNLLQRLRPPPPSLTSSSSSVPAPSVSPAAASSASLSTSGPLASGTAQPSQASGGAAGSSAVPGSSGNGASKGGEDTSLSSSGGTGSNASSAPTPMAVDKAKGGLFSTPIEDIGKRRKKRPAAEKAIVKKYIEVPLQPDGTPVLPIMLRGLTVHSLGKVLIEKKKFHAKNYIWPVGFKSSRQYMSMKNLDEKATYVSEILDGGDEPKFRITCLEEPPVVIEAATASGAWAEVGKRVNDLKESVVGKRMFTQLSGPEMYGYSHPTIAKFIQELPGAKQCDKYQFQLFEPQGESKGGRGKQEEDIMEPSDGEGSD